MSGFRSLWRVWAACFATLALVAGLPISDVSAASISVGKLGLGGTGCPAGTATATVSSDGSRLMIHFRQFQVMAGGKKSFDRKACGLSLPISVPAGMAVALVEVDYTGSARLPAGASATVAVETFVAGGEGPKVERTINGPRTGRFSFSNTARGSVWSACGASTNLRVNTSLRITTRGPPASASIRRQEVDAAIVYRLRFRRC